MSRRGSSPPGRRGPQRRKRPLRWPTMPRVRSRSGSGSCSGRGADRAGVGGPGVGGDPASDVRVGHGVEQASVRRSGSRGCRARRSGRREGRGGRSRRCSGRPGPGRDCGRCGSGRGRARGPRPCGCTGSGTPRSPAGHGPVRWPGSSQLRSLAPAMMMPRTWRSGRAPGRRTSGSRVLAVQGAAPQQVQAPRGRRDRRSSGPSRQIRLPGGKAWTNRARW